MKRLVLFAFVAAARWASASVVVDFNTVALTGLSSPPTLIFTLLNGDGLNNNTISISAVDLAGGSPVGSPSVTTGVSGTLLGGITMMDSLFQVEFAQAWNPGTALRFLLSFSTNFPGGSPDSFSVSILDPGTGLPIPTVDPLGTDTFLSVDLAGGAHINTYRSDLGRTSIDVPAPVITPEPGTFMAAGIGLGVVALICRRRTCKQGLKSNS